MLDNEVTPVLKALRTNGLDVVAIHHHMTGTQPTIIFLHYWGKGDAQKLARGVRAAVDRQFIDSVAVAMITPGPVVITVGFIGFLVAGFWGATVATAATLLPCFLFTVLPAPYFKRYAKRKDIAAFVTGVTAAATGAIAGAVIVLGKRSVVDWPTLLIAVVSAALLLPKRKIPEPLIVGAAALVGLFIHSS